MIENELVAELGKLKDSVSIATPYHVDVARHPEWGWLVLEEGAPNILVYSYTGDLVDSWGTRGRGPGELSWPSRIAMDSSDSLWVSDKGRGWLIVSPDGIASRTVQNAELLAVEGFSPDGSPYSMALFLGAASPARQTFRFVQLWTRDGGTQQRLGPGAFDPRATPEQGAESVPVPMTQPPQSAFVNDTTILTPGGWHTWVLRWTPTREDPLVTGDAVWRALALVGSPDRADGQPVAVALDSSTDIWVLGGIRRRTIDDEVLLYEEEAQRLGVSSKSTAVQNSVRIRNEVWQGVLLHGVLRDDGTVRLSGGIRLDESPWGFVDETHYYTFRETDIGIDQIRIWRIGCDET